MCNLTGRSYCFVVNPAAGGAKGSRVASKAAGVLRAKGAVVEVQTTKNLAHATELTLQAAAAHDVVVAVGGDGLVSVMAAALADHERGVLGVLPAGRGNDFARAMGIKNVKDAISVLTKGRETRIDMGTVNDLTFATIVGVGLDAEVIAVAERMSRVRGSLVYPLATLRALVHWKPAHFVVTVDGERHEVIGYSVAVANTGIYGGGMRIAPHARPDDGLLDVVAVGHLSKPRFLALSPKVFLGTHVRHPEVSVWQGSEITVEIVVPVASGGIGKTGQAGIGGTGSHPPVVVDGERRHLGLVRFAVRPKALSVLAP